MILGAAGRDFARARVGGDEGTRPCRPDTAPAASLCCRRYQLFRALKFMHTGELIHRQGRGEGGLAGR